VRAKLGNFIIIIISLTEGLVTGVKVNCERSCWAQQCGQKRSGAQKAFFVAETDVNSMDYTVQLTNSGNIKILYTI